MPSNHEFAEDLWRYIYQLETRLDGQGPVVTQNGKTHFDVLVGGSEFEVSVNRKEAEVTSETKKRIEGPVGPFPGY